MACGSLPKAVDGEPCWALHRLVRRINVGNASKVLKEEPDSYTALNKMVVLLCFFLLISQWKMVRQIQINYLHMKEFKHY